MTTEEKLIEMETNLEEINYKLDEVLVCLKGNDLGSSGLVADFKNLEKKVHDIELERIKEREVLAADKAKSEILMNVIKWLGGIIAALVIAYMFDQVYSKREAPQQQQIQQTK